jgi:hypothetical protein
MWEKDSELCLNLVRQCVGSSDIDHSCRLHDSHEGKMLTSSRVAHVSKTYVQYCGDLRIRTASTTQLDLQLCAQQGSITSWCPACFIRPQMRSLLTESLVLTILTEYPFATM